MVPWEQLWTERLIPAFDEVITVVRAARPSIFGRRGWDGEIATPVFPFRAYASFIYDPVNGDTVFLITFMCSQHDREDWHPDRCPYFAPESGCRHAVGLVMETGRGEVLLALPPRLLPEDVDSEEYAEAVTSYFDDAVVFIRDHHDFVIEATAPVPGET